MKKKIDLSKKELEFFYCSFLSKLFSLSQKLIGTKIKCDDGNLASIAKFLLKECRESQNANEISLNQTPNQNPSNNIQNAKIGEASENLNETKVS